TTLAAKFKVCPASVSCCHRARPAGLLAKAGEMLYESLSHRRPWERNAGTPRCSCKSKNSTPRKGFRMCDYSLHGVSSRPAKIADKIVTTELAKSKTRAFAAVGECGAR